MTQESDCHAPVASLLRDLGARAAGLWWVEGECLVQAAFVRSSELSVQVADDFAAATRIVPRSETRLGIVGAVTTGETTVSRVSELPETVGSGLWLRAFGAERSIAVPLRDDRGILQGVLSVALPDQSVSDEEIASKVRAAGATIRRFS